MSSIGARLRDKRREQGLNQKEVARCADVTNAAVSKWEKTGGESMSAVVALRLALRGLMLLAEVPAAGFLAVAGVGDHQLGELEEVGQTAGALQLLVELRAAADRGELTRLVLAHRIGQRPLPAVEIVDLVAEREKHPRGRRPILSQPLARALRGAGLAIELDDSGAAFGKQFKRADRCRAAWALILGDDEVEQGVVRVKRLQGEPAEQTIALSAISAIVDTLRSR